MTVIWPALLLCLLLGDSVVGASEFEKPILLGSDLKITACVFMAELKEKSFWDYGLHLHLLCVVL